MPLTGRGMLMTSMDIDPGHEAEFNDWYDREHLTERVAISGFLEARRYLAVEAAPKYLALYSTSGFDVLTGPAYRTALANQTPRSQLNISRFRNMGRAVARVTVSRGEGRGAALALVRLRPGSGERTGALRARAAERLDPAGAAGVIAIHVIESDPELSKPLTGPEAPNPGAGDWYVAVDGSEIEAVAALARERFADDPGPDAALVSMGTYRLLWDLAKADLEAAA